MRSKRYGGALDMTRRSIEAGEKKTRDESDLVPRLPTRLLVLPY